MHEIVVEGRRLTFVIDPEDPNYFRAAEFPDLRIPIKAHVHLKASSEGWGGNMGVTQFVEQEPPIKLRRIEDGEVRWQSSSTFMTANPHIWEHGFHLDPEKKFFPPELPEMIKFAEEKLGYTIDPVVKQTLLRAMAGE